MTKEQKNKTSLGLDENFVALLCYLLGWVTGLIFLLIEKENKFVKFHALQSLITFGVLNILAVLLVFISPIIWIVTLVAWIVLIVKAYQGKKYKLPWIGDFVEKQIK